MTVTVRLIAPNGYAVEIISTGRTPTRLAKALVQELAKMVDSNPGLKGASPLLRKLRDDRAREARQ